MASETTTAVTPVCTRCEYHVVGVLYYIDNRGPLCQACNDELMMKAHIRGGDDS